MLLFTARNLAFYANLQLDVPSVVSFTFTCFLMIISSRSASWIWIRWTFYTQMTLYAQKESISAFAMLWWYRTSRYRTLNTKLKFEIPIIIWLALASIINGGLTSWLGIRWAIQTTISCIIKIWSWRASSMRRRCGASASRAMGAWLGSLIPIIMRFTEAAIIIIWCSNRVGYWGTN